ncbi:MAG TPA: hypothetical protein VGM94_18785 [Galbitalea sp.]|jgi:hypothetical protein
MTDQPTLLAQAEPRARTHHRPGGWELALWILGVVLLGGTILAAQLVVSRLLDDNGSSAADRSGIAFAQVIYSVLPGAITAGLLCFVLAVALRAFEANVRRRSAPLAPAAAAPAAAAPTTAPATVAGSVEAEPVAAEPSVTHRQQGVAPTATGDYSRFMRPPGDAG